MKGIPGKWRLWLPTVLMVVLVIAFSWLAVWQYHRAHEREARIAAVVAAKNAPAVALAPAELAALPRYAHVAAVGHYDGAHQVLLLDMTEPRGPRVGYEVLTPLVLPSGARLLVNRGWVPVDAHGTVHADLAPPPGTVHAAGFLAPLPRPGLELGGNPGLGNEWPARLLFPSWAELEQLYGSELAHRVLFLESMAPGGYVRDWKLRPRHGPQQNYGYMGQWIAFAVIVFGLWLWFTLRRLRRGSDRS